MYNRIICMSDSRTRVRINVPYTPGSKPYLLIVSLTTTAKKLLQYSFKAFYITCSSGSSK